MVLLTLTPNIVSLSLARPDARDRQVSGLTYHVSHVANTHPPDCKEHPTAVDTFQLTRLVLTNSLSLFKTSIVAHISLRKIYLQSNKVSFAILCNFNYIKIRKHINQSSCKRNVQVDTYTHFQCFCFV